MKPAWLLTVSIVANLVLLVAVAYLLASQAGTSPAPLHAAAQPAAEGFRWSQLESKDEAVFVSNLLAVGCPEQTIRRIMAAPSTAEAGASDNGSGDRSVSGHSPAATEPVQKSAAIAPTAPSVSAEASHGSATWTRHETPVSAAAPPAQPATASSASAPLPPAPSAAAPMAAAPAQNTATAANASGGPAFGIFQTSAAQTSTAPTPAVSGAATAPSAGSGTHGSSSAGAAAAVASNPANASNPPAPDPSQAVAPATVSPTDPFSPEASMYRLKWGWQAFNAAQAEAVRKARGL